MLVYYGGKNDLSMLWNPTQMTKKKFLNSCYDFHISHTIDGELFSLP